MLNVTSALKFLLTSIYILKCSALFWCIFKYLKQFLLGSYFIFSPFSFFVLSLLHIAPESTDVTAKYHLMKLRTMIVQLLEIISNLSFARWLKRPWCLSAWKLLQPFTPKIMELWHTGCAYPSVKKKSYTKFLSWREENMPIKDICICDGCRKYTMMCFLALVRLVTEFS